MISEKPLQLDVMKLISPYIKVQEQRDSMKLPRKSFSIPQISPNPVAIYLNEDAYNCLLEIEKNIKHTPEEKRSEKLQRFFEQVNIFQNVYKLLNKKICLLSSVSDKNENLWNMFEYQ